MSVKLIQVLAELREDHRNLRLLLNLLESESASITVDDEPDFELMHDIMQYMTVYSDAVHHPKEDLVYGLIREHDTEMATSLEQVEPEHLDISQTRHDVAQRYRGDYFGHGSHARQAGIRLAGLRCAAQDCTYGWEEDELFPVADSLAATKWRRRYRRWAVPGRRPVIWRDDCHVFPQLAHLPAEVPITRCLTRCLAPLFELIERLQHSNVR